MDGDFFRRWSRCGIRVQNAGSFVFPSPGRYPLMRRDHWILAIVEAGRLTVDHVRRRVDAGAGQAYLIPPDIGLEEVVDTAGTCRRTTIDLNLFATPGIGNPLVELDLPLVVDLPRAVTLVPAVLGEFDLGGYRPRDRRAQVRARGPVDALLTDYLIAIADGAVEPAGSVARPRPAWLADLDRVMFERLRDPSVRLADLARGVGYSPTRVAHVCKAVHGQGPMARLRSFRLERAVHLLQNLRDPVIGDVAQRCGYRGASLFGRHFRRAFGCSPRAFVGRGGDAADADDA